MKTTAEIITEAHAIVGTWDRGDIITETIRMGYNISPVKRAFRAIDALKQGLTYDDKKWSVWGQGAYYDSQEFHRKRYATLKASGICVKCAKEPAADNRTYCPACSEKDRQRKRKGGGAIGKRVV